MTDPRSANPFVGPRPLDHDDPIFGRDREIDDLLNLLIAERIVLLHSPSGAGKTSLIRAGLTPRLDDEEFDVLPLMRVNSPEAAGAPNPYLLSCMLALEERFDEEDRLPPEVLADLTFAHCLTKRHTSGDRPVVLIFDQFEEILSLNPGDRAGKEEFFQQVGEALRDRERWALFAMREEYVARLEGYQRPIPTRFANTFPLDLLGPNAATAAIRGPAGDSFTPGAVDALVHDLRRVVDEDARGEVRAVEGEFVEPVQLQVVCRDLWQRYAPTPDSPVDEAAVTQYGNINQALRVYYANGLAKICEETGVAERAMRDWFGRALIQSDNRMPVRHGPARAEGGFHDEVLTPLVDAHLVRTETRRGATWYELAHDRLIEPIEDDNKAWRSANLSELQRQAELWADQERFPGLLFLGDRLVDAQRWADQHELTSTEEQFLAASRAEQQRLDDEARQSRNIRRLAAVAITLFFVGLIASAIALSRSQAATQAEATAQAEATRANDEATRAIAQSTRAWNAEQGALAQSTIAANEAERAIAQSTRAFSAEATAVAEAEKAVLAQTMAEAQARRARANELALYAQNRMDELGGADDTALILARDAVRTTWDAPEQRVGEFPMSALIKALESHYIAEKLLPVRHSWSIRSAAFNHDGSRVVTGNSEGTAIIWDVESGHVLATLSGHSGGVNSAAFNHDGSRVVTASSDGMAMIWDVRGGEVVVTTLSGHSGGVNSAVFNHDGSRVMTASDDRTVIIWDAESGEVVRRLVGQWRVYSATYSPDGSRVATGGASAEVIIWDADSGEKMKTLVGHIGVVHSTAYSPDGSQLLTGSYDGAAIIWDTESGEGVTSLFGHSGSVLSAAFNDDGSRAVLGNRNGTTVIWDVGRGKALTLIGHSDQVNSAVYSPDGNWVATGSDDGTAIIWDTQGTGAVTTLFVGRYGGSAAFSPNGSHVVTGNSDRGAIIWDTESGEQVRMLTGYGDIVSSAVYSPDGRRVLTTSWDETAMIWDTQSGVAVTTLSGHNSDVSSAAYSPDGSRVVTASEDGTAIIWDTGTGEELTALSGHGGRVSSVAFNHDGSRVVTASEDSTAIIWDAGTGEELTALSGHGGWVRSAAFNHDGSRVATGSSDGTAIIWDVQGGEALKTLSGRSGMVLSAAYSPDGSRVVTANEDGTAIIWDTETGEELTTLSGHRDWVLSAAFNHDGSRVVTASQDGTAKIWWSSPSRWIELADTRIARHNKEATQEDRLEFNYD